MEHLSCKSGCGIRTYVNVLILRSLKEELAWAADKWLQVISNKMLFKAVIPLRNLSWFNQLDFKQADILISKNQVLHANIKYIII